MPPTAPTGPCLALEDNSRLRRSAAEFFRLPPSRDPNATAARLAQQFLDRNRAPMHRLETTGWQEYDGHHVYLNIETGNAVGAVPLLSPSTARPDFGLVVQPRFDWAGVGPMLAAMGWRVVPQPLRLPLLRRSERRVPAWVLSSLVLARLEALLRQMDQRFEMVERERAAPRGEVLWSRYATANLPRGRAAQVPCRYPDLQQDAGLRGSIRYTLERQLASLRGQLSSGAVVVRSLMAWAQAMLQQVQTVAACVPTPRQLAAWRRHPLRREAFFEGLQAMEWTAEDRGLAGLSDLDGLPWTMPMAEFFEAWIETVFRQVGRLTGAILKTGRRGQTTAAIQWDRAYQGSQKSLRPDLVLDWEAMTLIVDAKYKRHWEELATSSWSGLDERLQSSHRHDLMQVLAYANVARTREVIVCLAYPCTPATWNSLSARGERMRTAHVGVAGREVRIWLTAVPMQADVAGCAGYFAERLRPALSFT